MARGRGFPLRSQFRNRSRRSTTWGLGPNATPIALSGSGSALWTASSSLLLESKVTITRVRGHAFLMMLTAAASGDGFQGAIGMGVFSSEAVAAGAASIPGPQSDSDWDGWLYHQFFNVHFINATQTSGVNAAVGVVRIDIDSKAMRIQEDSQLLVGVIEQTENGTATAEFWADTRILDKLS